MGHPLNGWSDVDSLLFPVKLAPEALNVPQDFGTSGLGVTPRLSARKARPYGVLAGLLTFWLVGCGYGPAYSSAQHYQVVMGELRTAHFEASQAALAGVRVELAAASAGSTDGYPQVVVDVLRVDERSTGVQATNDAPLARGTEVVVVGRARVLTAPGEPPTYDTGDMSRSAQYASGASASEDSAARSRAVRDAARNLGRALGRAVLGLPEPAEG
jgi:hypothetical protein